MKAINYNNGTSIINLNEVAENVSKTLNKPAYIEYNFGFYSFWVNNDKRYTSKSKEAIYAYMCGILNFATK